MSLETDSYTRRRVPLHVPVSRRFTSSLSVSPPHVVLFLTSVSLFVATDGVTIISLYRLLRVVRTCPPTLPRRRKRRREGAPGVVFFFHSRSSPGFSSRRFFSPRFHFSATPTKKSKIQIPGESARRWDSTDNERWDIRSLNMLRVQCF